MRRPSLALLALAAAAAVAAAPAPVPTSADAPTGVEVRDAGFPIGVCAWARPVSERKFCVFVHDPRPYLP